MVPGPVVGKGGSGPATSRLGQLKPFLRWVGKTPTSRFAGHRDAPRLELGYVEDTLPCLVLGRQAADRKPRLLSWA